MKYFCALTAAAILAGCVNPEVVTSRSVDDDSLTCTQIAEQKTTLNAIRKEAEAGKSVSGANVAAAVLFWPAIIGNNMNANQALEAANNRDIVLNELAQKKNCKFKSIPTELATPSTGTETDATSES